MHPGEAIGDWSDYVNNNAGSIGSRGQILVHPDLGQDGTAGCVGVLVCVPLWVRAYALSQMMILLFIC